MMPENWKSGKREGEVILLMAAALGVVFALAFTCPKFEQIFKDMLGNKPLPPLTVLVLGASRVFRSYWPVAVFLMVMTAVASQRVFLKTPTQDGVLVFLLLLIAGVFGVIVIGLFMPFDIIVKGDRK